MATIPTHHVVGDPGHTDDHNAVTDVLNDHQTRVAALEGVQASYMVKTGANTITLTNPAGIAETITIPSGTRDTSVWVKSVSYGGTRTFALDTYGQPRFGAAMTTEVPLTVWGYSASQTGDLQRWRQYQGGPVLTRVGPDGTVYAPNITPGVWTNITLSSGLVWSSGLGSRPQYRIVGDCVELRGAVQKTTGDFTTSPQDLGVIPTGAAPPYQTYGLGGSQFSAGQDHVRIEVQTGGLIRFYFASSTYTPTWVSLDNFRYSRTA